MTTYNIEPNSDIIVLERDNGIIPEASPDHRVVNIGRAEVLAQTLYGTKFSWIGVVNSATVKPGENAVIDNYGRPYYVLGLKLINSTGTRAIVSASYNRSFSFYQDLALYRSVDYNNLLKQLVVAGVKFIPYVGSTLSAVINFFWPNSKPNIFEQIREEIEQLLDQKILETVNALLSGDIRQYEERIKNVQEDAENGIDPGSIRTQFMNIAQDLIGFEKKFYFGKEHSDYMTINLHIFPLFSNVISMKMNFYHAGIKEAQKFGLTTENVEELRRMKNKLIISDTGVKGYITQFYNDQVDYAYNTSSPDVIFNTMMNVRSVVTVYGLEYLPVWQDMLQDNPSDKVYVDAIAYSEYFGRKTGNLDNQAIPVVMPPPLTPSLVGNRRTKIAKIDVYIWRIHAGTSTPGPRKIGGMKITFEDSQSYTLGTVSSDIQTVEFKGADLLTLTVSGSLALDRLTFKFSDGREVTVGTDDSKVQGVFELGRHKIASIFVSSDSRGLAGQAANIAVSYQVIS